VRFSHLLRSNLNIESVDYQYLEVIVSARRRVKSGQKGPFSLLMRFSVVSGAIRNQTEAESP
jgi:hypothetical protein